MMAFLASLAASLGVDNFPYPASSCPGLSCSVPSVWRLTKGTLTPSLCSSLALSSGSRRLRSSRMPRIVRPLYMRDYEVHPNRGSPITFLCSSTMPSRCTLLVLARFRGSIQLWTYFHFGFIWFSSFYRSLCIKTDASHFLAQCRQFFHYQILTLDLRLCRRRSHSTTTRSFTSSQLLPRSTLLLVKLWTPQSSTVNRLVHVGHVHVASCFSY